jgi:hypothetical protein
LGRANYGPAQVAGSGLTPFSFLFFEKKPKKFKNPLKKIMIFSNIFLPIFV